ncbi:MAG: class I SAM-dependent methyltransferase [Acidimicrobiia bacterium]|nr:class I SAM-dependent methyltransferase [Acidimicrobiia bacterium]
MWAADEVTWGLFAVPERELGVLGDVSGIDVLDLGCGTGWLCAWLARRGAVPVGLDVSRPQLETARRCGREFGIDFPLVEASAEEIPLASSAFDLVVSEYGAAPWCEPDRWLGEAARVLRPGGRLVFLTNSVLAALCVPSEGGFAGDRLLRGMRDIRRITWPGGGTEHHPGHGEWIRAIRGAGLEIEALHELYPPAGATVREPYEIVTPEWAARWPAEDVWVARRPRARPRL